MDKDTLETIKGFALSAKDAKILTEDSIVDVMDYVYAEIRDAAEAGKHVLRTSGIDMTDVMVKQVADILAEDGYEVKYEFYLNELCNNAETYEMTITW